jgi:hypothetical protein
MVKARVVRRMHSPGALANPQTVLAMFGTPLVATGALVLASPPIERERAPGERTLFGGFHRGPP